MSNPLSPAEYRKAIFIDFEGEGRNKARELKLPHMVGEFRPNQAGDVAILHCFPQDTKSGSVQGI